MKVLHVQFQLFILSSILFVAFSACKKNGLKNCKEHSVSACKTEPTKTNIRIKNNSDYNFCNVMIDPSSQKVNCGIVKKGKMTCYRSFDTAYRYAYIQLFIGDKEFSIHPIDYVGEEPLGPGNFTYLLDITDYNAGKVTITLQKD